MNMIDEVCMYLQMCFVGRCQIEVVSKELSEASRDIDVWLREEEMQQAASSHQVKQKKFCPEEHLRKNLEHQRRLGIIEKQVT